MARLVFLLALFLPLLNVHAASFPKGTPLFYQNGSRVISVICGDTYSFDVVGYSNQNVWIEMKKDGTTVFDGLFLVPMNNYTSRCNNEANDAGKYDVVVYESENNVKGKAVAGAVFNVQPRNTEDLYVFRSVAPGVIATKIPVSNTKAELLFYFLRKYKPDMDVVMTVPADSWLKVKSLTSGFPSSGGPLRPSLVEGIGRDGLDTSYGVAADSRFYGAAFLPTLKDFNKDRDYIMGTLLHEIGHSWNVYMAPTLLGTPHWSLFVDSSYALMGSGMKMTDNNNGTFRVEWKPKKAEQVFNDFDLYAMGLLSPENIRPILAISPVSGISSDQLWKEIANTYSVGGNVKAQRNKDITINDIISIEGRRNPTLGFTKNNPTNNLHVSFVVVQGPYGDEKELQDVLVNMKDAMALFPAEWSRATRGLSTATIFDPVLKPSPAGNSFAASLTEDAFVEDTEKILNSHIHEHPVPTDTTTTQSTLSLTDKLKQILDRLVVLQTELLDLISRRLEFLRNP